MMSAPVDRPRLKLSTILRNRRVIRKAVLIAVGAILLLALARLIILGWHGALCRAPFAVDSSGKSLNLPGGACWEFWANRYQVAAGSLVAIVAAGLAWRLTQRQIAAERVKTLRQDLHTVRRVRSLNSRINEYIAPLLDVGRVRSMGESQVEFDRLRRFADDGLADVIHEQNDRETVSQLYQTMIMNDDMRRATDDFRTAAKAAHQQSRRLFLKVSGFVGTRPEECRAYELLVLAEGSRVFCEQALNGMANAFEAVHAALTAEIDRLSGEINALPH